MNFVPSNEAISTLEKIRYLKYITFGSKLQWTRFSRSSSTFCCLCFAVTFYRSGEQSLCSSHFRSGHFPFIFARSFSSIHSSSFQNFRISWFWIYFLLPFFFAVSWLMDLKYWDCLHIRFLYSLILFYLCFFRFSSILLDSQWQKKKTFHFFNWIFSLYFRYWADLQKSGGINFFIGSCREKYISQHI